jgi:flagellar biogenesis protein FliO
MLWMIRRFALGMLAGVMATPLFAEPTPGPPDWNDSAGSVYLQNASAATAAKDAAVLPELHDAAAAGGQRAAEPVHADPGAPAREQQAVATAPKNDGRRLAPRREKPGSRTSSAAGADKSSAWRTPMRIGIPAESMVTIGSALAIVLGAFLMFAWALRRGGKKMSAPLPADVVSVLGRVPLAARQFAELLRVGNKLVLVSLTPTGAEPLTEVTDPVEVDRLVGLCQQSNPHSTTKAFEQVFRQLSRESAPAGFPGDTMAPFSPAATYRAHRGDHRA